MHPYLFPAIVAITVLLAIVFNYPVISKYGGWDRVTVHALLLTTFFVFASFNTLYGTCAIIFGKQEILESIAWSQIRSLNYTYFVCMLGGHELYIKADKDPNIRSRFDNVLPVSFITILFCFNMVHIESIDSQLKRMQMALLAFFVVNTLKKRI